MNYSNFIVFDSLLDRYPDVYTPEALAALDALACFNVEIKAAMDLRAKNRRVRIMQRKRISFLEDDSFIPRTAIRVSDARAGNFEGGTIPHDLQRQWIQGTGPAAKPNAPEIGRAHV